VGLVKVEVRPYADVAMDYLLTGWSPIPLPPQAKYPPPKGWTGYDAPIPSAADVYDWADNGHAGSNVALRLSDTIIGIDVDAYDGKPGEQTMLDAIDRLGPLPKTYVVTSRDDGVSGIRLYRVPPGRCWADVIGPGVEIIHHGHRYVTAPPSLHPSGRVYRCLGPDRQPCDMPAVDEVVAELPPQWVAEYDRGDAADRAQKADLTPAEVAAFLADAPAGDPCRYVNRLIEEATTGLDVAASRHDLTRNYVAKIIRAADQGHHGTGVALDTVEAAFTAAIAADTTRPRDAGEWARMVVGAVRLVNAEPTPALDKGCCGPIPELDDFWSARPELAAVHGWARARMAAPTAVLAVVLARVIAATPPFVVLPPIIGGEASLNLFFALVGNAGGGKGAAERAGAAAIDVAPYDGFHETSAGSGEGIAHLFMHRVKGEPKQHTEAAMLSVAEVDTLAGLKHRQGSTLMPELRKAWMGEPLGFAYADPAKRLPVRAHKYRLNLLVGVQPTRAAVLVDDADGGTPQRLVWMPTTDSAMPDDTPDPPGRIIWKPPTWPAQNTDTNWLSVLDVCHEATSTIRVAHLARQRGQGDALDGHALLCRLKVAAALGILAGRADVTDEDWRLAGLIMRQSDHTRTLVVDRLRAKQQQANVAQGEAEATREVIKRTAVENADVQRVCQAIIRRLRRDRSWVTRRDVRGAVTPRLRGHFDGAVEKLADAGQIEVNVTAINGQDGTQYRLCEGVQ